MEAIAPDIYGPAGAAWHLARKSTPDELGTLAVSLLELPGNEASGIWFLSSLKVRYSSSGTTGQPVHEFQVSLLDRYSFKASVISILAAGRIRPSKCMREAEGEPYPPICVEFSDLENEQALAVFDAAVRTLVNGFLLPTFDCLDEWRYILLSMVDRFAPLAAASQL